MAGQPFFCIHLSPVLGFIFLFLFFFGGGDIFAILATFLGRVGIFECDHYLLFVILVQKLTFVSSLLFFFFFCYFVTACLYTVFVVETLLPVDI